MTMSKSWTERTVHLLLFIVLLLSFTWPIHSSSGSKDIVIVFDASGSMRDMDSSEDGLTELIPEVNQKKIDAAKAAVSEFLETLSANQRVALIVFYDCDNIQVETSFTSDYSFITGTLENIEPSGSTALGDSLLFAWEYLKDNGERNHSWFIVVFTDGNETCSSDPCGVAQKIAAESQSFVDTPVYTIGFLIQPDSDAETELACIAYSTGGDYIPASSAEELEKAFREIALEIDPPIGELYLYIAAVVSITFGSLVSFLILQKYAERRGIRPKKRKDREDTNTEHTAERESIIWVLGESDVDEESDVEEFVEW